MTELSVVIICWNSLANLRRLLESVPAAVEGIACEVIVVDNGSTDGTPDFIATREPAVKYVRLDRNYGVAYARNRGIERARGRYIWLLDDDTEINPGATRTLLNHMLANPRCGICACALRNSAGELQESFKPFPGLGVKLRNVVGLRSRSPYAAQIQRGEPFEPVYVIGACQLIRREVFEAVGLLDEKIFYGPEDADFCLRARRAGWTVDYLPRVSIIHEWKRITTRRPFSKIGRAHIRALIYFYIKHRKI